MSDAERSGVFIGGPMAGQQQAVPHGNIVRMYNRDTEQEFRYRLQYLAGDNDRFGLWVPEEWSADEMVAELLAGYMRGAST